MIVFLLQIIKQGSEKLRNFLNVTQLMKVGASIQIYTRMTPKPACSLFHQGITLRLEEPTLNQPLPETLRHWIRSLTLA